MKTSTLALFGAAALGAAADAAHTPSIQFSTNADLLRDQVLKSGGVRYAMPFNGGDQYRPAPNQPIREIATGAKAAITTRKPNHQYQVNSLVGSTGAAGGWVGFDEHVPEGFVYTPSHGTTYIAPMPGHSRTNVLGVSADGDAAFGRSFSGSTGTEFYWSRSGQMVDVNAATYVSGKQDFKALEMRSDGLLKGVLHEWGPTGGNFEATWSPSQGIKVIGPVENGTLKKVASPFGTLRSSFDTGEEVGSVTLVTPSGQVRPLLKFELGQAADSVAMTADGRRAIVNADVDPGDNLYLPRALALDAGKFVDEMNPFQKNPELADYLVELGLDASTLQGNILYNVLAASPDGRLLFGSAGKDIEWDPQTESYFLIDLGPSAGGQATPEPASWMIVAVVVALVAGKKRLIG